MNSSPILSAVLIVGDLRSRSESCLARLLEQTALDRMEIVVVDVSDGGKALAGSDHPAVRTVTRPDLALYSQAQAECVRQARGELVAFIEDHCYARPGWAAAVIEAFDPPDVALVTYSFLDHNPERYVSRAFFVAEYGRWMAPNRSRRITIPTCNNIAYRRSWLDPYEDRLEEMFEAEFVMHRQILARGGVAWLASEAEVEHENWVSLRGGLRANNSMRRVNAARRAELSGYGWVKRIAFSAAMLLAPGLHLLRLARSLVDRPSLWGRFFSALPISLLMYSTSSLEEARGYLFGPGKSRESFKETELCLPRTRR